MRGAWAVRTESEGRAAVGRGYHTMRGMHAIPTGESALATGGGAYPMTSNLLRCNYVRRWLTTHIRHPAAFTPIQIVHVIRLVFDHRAIPDDSAATRAFPV